MTKFLTLKHWHLFLLICICGAWISPSPLKEVINSIAIVSFSCWIYTIGVYGQEKISEIGLNPMNLTFFKINVLVVPVFFLLGIFVFSGTTTTPSETIVLKDIPSILGGLYFFFAIFQIIIFASKTIAKVELRKEVSFSDYLPNMLLFVFLFIGVWILQPKVNKNFTRNENTIQ